MQGRTGFDDLKSVYSESIDRRRRKSPRFDAGENLSLLLRTFHKFTVSCIFHINIEVMPPPKLRLQLDTASLAHNDLGQRSIDNVLGKNLEGVDRGNLDQKTINIDKNGNLQLIKSYQAIEFNNSGVNINQTRNAVTSPLATGAQQHHQSYQLSEKDVMFMETLGSGASGIVQKAFWPARSEFVAVKKISIMERDKRHQLMNDIKALCNIPDVKGLIRFHGAYHSADKGQVAVALEFMDGGSLADLCGKKSRVPQQMLAGITESILEGLSYLHSKHAVHRDIKPANILLSTRGDAKVSDFGISAFVDNTLAQCHTFLGTVTYMSPERIDGQPYSFPADIWALGLTLLECATGKYPYDASKGTMQLMLNLMEEECPLPRSHHDNMSEALKDFIHRCMHKNPLKRPTATELLRHPFVVGEAKCKKKDLRVYMQSCMLDRDSQIHDASLIMTWKFYNNLSYNAGGNLSGVPNQSPHASHMTSSFFDVAVTLKSSAPPTSPSSNSTQQMHRGQYTVAAHFHDIVRQIGPKTCFSLLLRRMKYKENSSGKFLVNIMQKVQLYDCPASKASRKAPVGAYEENLVVEVRSIDDLVPGTGFRFMTMEALWTKPLESVGADGLADRGGVNGCKTQ
jgi:serine/threonine protein kinase